MKNKDRITQLELQVENLVNRVALLEMRTSTKDTATPQFPQYLWNPKQYPNSTPYYINYNAKH